MTVNGRTGSIYSDSLDDLWNADEIVDVRAQMARGEQPAACGSCWKREAMGGASRRLLINSVYRGLDGGLAVESLPDEGAATGYRLERRPDWFVLELGNVCNLKCRSCVPLLSTRIAADRVHRAWVGGGLEKPRSAWFDDVDAMADMVASGCDDNAMLSLMGGEPFLISCTWRLLSALVERGVARRLYVGLATNGQQRSEKLAELAPHFRGFNLSLSIDAHGKLYEYMRSGASWSKFVDNLRWFRHIPNVDLAIVPTLQNCNVLDIVPLLRFVDEHDLPLGYNVLTKPARLSPTNLPPSVRRIAARRIRHYLDTECKPVNLAVVRSYYECLEEAGDEFDPEVFAEFMTFTNDLDADRGESLHDVAPELVALVRAAGLEWSNDRRYVPAAAAAGAALLPADALQRVNRTVSPRDVIFPGFEAARPDAYFTSAVSQLDEIDALLRQHGHAGLAGSRAVADFACHFGRMTRALRVALPHSAVYACDIDADAVRFCAGELGALPVVTSWRPDEQRLPEDLDAVVCVSLLTHTPLAHWRRALRAWARMLRPGGVAAFTYLSERRVAAWLDAEMEHYGTYPQEARAATAHAVREHGFGFVALTSEYGGEAFYGIAFATPEVVEREVAAAGLELVVLPADTNAVFGQDLALVRRPRAAHAPQATVPAVQRDVSLVALYDPRCYAPANAAEGARDESFWARLLAAEPGRPLPTELGFGDPRVPEVREAQAALAREHAVDAFCYLYPWGVDGPLWDAPLGDLIATGRPDFPFCVMIAVEGREAITDDAAAEMLDRLAGALRDRRYLQVDGRSLLVVRDLHRFSRPRAVAAAWRAAAAAHGLGELHLCAAEPAPGDSPADLGFDSFLEVPHPAADPAQAAAAALARPWPSHRLFRAVECRRDAADPTSAALYEHWLHAVVDATRRRAEKLVFIDAWNAWPRGAYLEPDDGGGRDALLATRRAARGPRSAPVLLRRLRDALDTVDEPVAAALGELEQVVEMQAHARDRLQNSIEAMLGRYQAPDETLRSIPVPSRQLPPSGGHLYLGNVGGVEVAAMSENAEPITLCGESVRVAGWAHAADCAPGEVDLFVALESVDGTEDRVVRAAERLARPDVPAAFPQYHANCGFDVVVNIADLPLGVYRVAVVQRTPDATYRDLSPVSVERSGAPCSSA